MKLGWGFVKPIPRKQTTGSRVSATHCTQRGADCVCNTLVPETGPPFWKPFLLPAILWPRFWGRFLAPFLGPQKSKQELLTAPAFLLQRKPPYVMGCDFGGFNQQKQGRQKETIVDRNVGELVGQITTIMIFSSKISKSTAVSWVVVHKVNVSYKWTTMISHWKWSRCRGTVAKVVLTQN